MEWNNGSTYGADAQHTMMAYSAINSTVRYELETSCEEIIDNNHNYVSCEVVNYLVVKYMHLCIYNDQDNSLYF